MPMITSRAGTPAGGLASSRDWKNSPTSATAAVGPNIRTGTTSSAITSNGSNVTISPPFSNSNYTVIVTPVNTPAGSQNIPFTYFVSGKLVNRFTLTLIESATPGGASTYFDWVAIAN